MGGFPCGGSNAPHPALEGHPVEPELKPSSWAGQAGGASAPSSSLLRGREAGPWARSALTACPSHSLGTLTFSRGPSGLLGWRGSGEGPLGGPSSVPRPPSTPSLVLRQAGPPWRPWSPLGTMDFPFLKADLETRGSLL